MKRWLLGVVSAVVFICAPTAHGVIGTIDVAPASTLLYPYFEVDLANANGVTTLLAVHNSSATAILVHFTLWTDLGIPTQSFNSYLTGYDLQTINLRDILVNNLLPRTASAGQDPGDTISPKGTFSQDINFASCNAADPDDFGFGDDGPLPSYGLPPDSTGFLVATHLADLQRAHSGQPLATAVYGTVGRCQSVNLGDGILRGYVTADTINNCTTRIPTDPGYFVSGGGGDATNQNVMFGDFVIVDPSQNFAVGDLAVHVEASASDPLTITPGNQSFYGRLTTPTTASNREALPTKFAAFWRTDSDLVSWRDPAQLPPAGGFTCGSFPAGGFPMGANLVQAFDTEEHPLAYAAGTAFRWAAGQDPVDAVTFPASAAEKGGWILVDLNETAVGGSVYGTATRQGWLLHRSGPEPPGGNGRFSSMNPAIQLDDTFFSPPPRPAGTALGGGK